MESLRDLGYDLPQAVAELVDNSIDAEATRVEIQLTFAGLESWLRVSDNGRGMTGRDLDEAMRYGSGVGSYRPGALGGFGLGLKTASFSQARRLTVASRRSARARLEVRRWDLDEIDELDDWLLERVVPSDAPVESIEPLRNTSGTSVMWQVLDRVLLYRDPEGGRAQNGLNAMAADLARHLSMVFHRFLAGEARRALPLAIVVNGREIEPWDPFARAEPATEALPVHEIEVAGDDASYTVTASPFLLPSQQQFSTPEAHQEAGGPRKWNRQQGFYIYREDRLIQSGGWNRLRTQDEHTKLARVALNIPREADDVFGVNVSKMRVAIPDALRPTLRAMVTAVAARAQGRYRTKRDTEPVRNRSKAAPGEGRVASSGSGLSYADVSAEFIPRARVVSLLRNELSDQPALLRRIVAAVLDDDWGAGPSPNIEVTLPEEPVPDLAEAG